MDGYILVPNLVYCSYWGTISRVLAGRKPWHDGKCKTTDIVEVNVTPVNGWDCHDAKDQIAGVKIRRHMTTRGKKDRDINLLAQHHYDALVKCAGENNAKLILFGNILPMIDWDRYYKACNGGANLADIKL